MSYLRRTWKEINLSALGNNFDIIGSITGTSVCAVVKADAYGHGAVGVAKALEEKGAAAFAVSNIREAEELRTAGIKAQILILGYTPEIYAEDLSRLGFVQCIYSLEYAENLSREAKKIGVTVEAHLKLDTGMSRLGFDVRDADFVGLQEAKRVLTLENLNITGVFTHFAVADSKDGEDITFTKHQYARFNEAADALETDGFRFKTRHCCNSAGALWGIADKGDMVRAGIILYGLAPSPDIRLPSGMKPVMSLYSVVSMVKTVKAGTFVSYGRTYEAEGDRIIATVSAGYADGVPRALSNKGSVLINGKRAKIVGRVCMDQFCIDITDIENVRIGDRVEVFGENISVDEVAEIAGTINYEIICGISKRVDIGQ